MRKEDLKICYSFLCQLETKLIQSEDNIHEQLSQLENKLGEIERQKQELKDLLERLINEF